MLFYPSQFFSGFMKNFDAEAFSSILDWKQFERFAGSIFEAFDFEVFLNYRMTNPRLEIDLLAIRNRLAFASDCKHWKSTKGHATMARVAERQVKRCRSLLKPLHDKQIIPVVLTLHEESLQVLENGVSIVPIQKLPDFIQNWESFSDQLLILRN